MVRRAGRSPGGKTHSCYKHRYSLGSSICSVTSASQCYIPFNRRYHNLLVVSCSSFQRVLKAFTAGGAHSHNALSCFDFNPEGQTHPPPPLGLPLLPAPNDLMLPFPPRMPPHDHQSPPLQPDIPLPPRPFCLRRPPGPDTPIMLRRQLVEPHLVRPG